MSVYIRHNINLDIYEIEELAVISHGLGIAVECECGEVKFTLWGNMNHSHT